MSFENRGGIPRVFRATIDTSGRYHLFPSIIKYLQVSNEGGAVLRLYFTPADFAADANYIRLSATTGFFEGPVEAKEIWFKAEAGSTEVVATSYSRRG